MIKSILNWFNDSLDSNMREKQKDIGLLFVRVSIGSLMLFGHGLQKLLSFSEKAAHFPDPLGVGSTLSLGLVVFAEFFCSLALIFGFFTRYAVIPLIITMLMAIFVIHADDPWGKQEFGTIYLTTYLTLFLAGGGKYSIDSKFR